MSRSSTLAGKLIERAGAGRAEAKANGYVASDGTYTFTNKEAAYVMGALFIARQLLDGDLEGALVAAGILAMSGDEGRAINRKLSNELIEKQAPPYIIKAVDDTLAEARQTDPRLS